MTYTTLQELFADPARWTKGENARDSNGKATSIFSEEAVSYCLIGGAHLVYMENSTAARNVYFKLSKALGELHVTEFNDNPATTHADVLALVTRENV